MDDQIEHAPVEAQESAVENISRSKLLAHATCGQSLVARAGTGFSVVADKVRSLAQRSAQAARDTSSLVEESIAKSKGGKAKVREVSSIIRTITTQAAQTKSLVEQVSSSSVEQSRGFEQITSSTAAIQRVTQTSAATSEECAAAAEELGAQSAALREIVGRLSTPAGGPA